ncbi:MAG: hypothetical protein AAF975_00005, partial [Spirochaetota bacterium]
MEHDFSHEQKKGSKIAEENLARIPQAAECFRQVAEFIDKQKDFCPVGDIKIKTAHRTGEYGVIELEGSFILRYEYTPQSGEPTS